jgi:hypothetical protein
MLKPGTSFRCIISAEKKLKLKKRENKPQCYFLRLDKFIIAVLYLKRPYVQKRTNTKTLAQASQNTCPQLRQWCFRRVRENPSWQPWQFAISSLGCQWAWALRRTFCA